MQMPAYPGVITEQSAVFGPCDFARPTLSVELLTLSTDGDAYQPFIAGGSVTYWYTSPLITSTFFM